MRTIDLVHIFHSPLPTSSCLLKLFHSSPFLFFTYPTCLLDSPSPPSPPSPHSLPSSPPSPRLPSPLISWLSPVSPESYWSTVFLRSMEFSLFYYVQSMRRTKMLCQVQSKVAPVETSSSRGEISGMMKEINKTNSDDKTRSINVEEWKPNIDNW